MFAQRFFPINAEVQAHPVYFLRVGGGFISFHTAVGIPIRMKENNILNYWLRSRFTVL